MNRSVSSRLQAHVPESGSDPVVLRLRLIGQMAAWTLTSESVLPAGRKTRALLAMVALSAPRPVLRSRLAEMLWSRRSEEQARASLRQEIHRLLETLSVVGSDVLRVTRDQIALKPGAVWIDVDEVMRATTAHPASLSLLDGELLDGMDGIDGGFDTWLVTERERLRDRARAVAEALLREQVEPETTIQAAQQLLAIDRAHEGAWRALMQGHAARGERGLAIQTYERCKAALADLLDTTPSPETERLATEIRNSKGPRPALPSPGREEQRPPLGGGATQPASGGQHGASSRGGARVGVLPLQFIGPAGDAAHLSTGLAEEITSALARFRWMFLVSSTSLARYAEQSRDEMAIHRTFGIDFLLDGKIQIAGARLRIQLRLADLREGNQIVWARTFDRESHDLLTLQDEVAAEVVAQIDPEILLIESQRVSNRAAHDPNAYDLVLRAIPLIGRLDRDDFTRAGQLLEQAINQEADYAAAHAWYAYWHILYVGQRWATDQEGALAQAGKLAERAITLDPADAKALTIAGHVRAFLHHRLREAVSLHERALMLNPNLAMAWALSGIAYSYLGDTGEAESRLNRYKRLSPMDPLAFFFDSGFIILHLVKRDYAAAREIGRTVSEMNPSFTAGLKHYLSALGHLGQAEEAAQIRERLLALEPDFTITRFISRSPFERASDKVHYAAGLRLAGIAE